MAVRAEHGRDAAIGEMTERHFFARRLGVKVDEDRSGIDTEPEFGEKLFEPTERIVERVHEKPAHQVDDKNVLPCDRVEPPSGARGSLRKVRRAQNPRIAVDIGDDLPLVPYVIAGGQHVDLGIVKFAAQAFGQATACRRVLRIDDDQIDRKLAAQKRHVLLDGLAARPPYHVPTKQDVHTAPQARNWLRSGAGSAVGVQLLRGPP